MRSFRWFRVLLCFPSGLSVLVAACQDDDACAAAGQKVEACVRSGFTRAQLAFQEQACKLAVGVCVAGCVNRSSECASLDCAPFTDPNAPPWTDDHVAYCRCEHTCMGDLPKDGAH